MHDLTRVYDPTTKGWLKPSERAKRLRRNAELQSAEINLPPLQALPQPPIPRRGGRPRKLKTVIYFESEPVKRTIRSTEPQLAEDIDPVIECPDCQTGNLIIYGGACSVCELINKRKKNEKLCDEDFAEMFERGDSPETIANYCGISIDSVERRFFKLDKEIRQRIMRKRGVDEIEWSKYRKRSA